MCASEGWHVSGSQLGSCGRLTCALLIQTAILDCCLLLLKSNYLTRWAPQVWLLAATLSSISLHPSLCFFMLFNNSIDFSLFVEHTHESCLQKGWKWERKTGEYLAIGVVCHCQNKVISLLGPSGTTAQLGEIIWDCHIVMQRVNGKIRNYYTPLDL